MKTPKNPITVKTLMSNGLLLEGMCGNKKVPTTTLIINMGSANSCPSDALALCPFGKENGDGTCYALKAERQYKSSRLFRDRQKEEWLNSSSEDLVKALKHTLLSKPYIDAVRFSESGDFHGPECIGKMNDIADAIDVPVYTYTHRTDLFDENTVKGLSKNLTINFSKKLEFEHDHNYFILGDLVDGGEDHIPCCGDCKICTLCVTRKQLTISTEVH